MQRLVRYKGLLPCQISPGELNINRCVLNSLEQSLKQIFKIANHFTAVVALDKADEFME